MSQVLGLSVADLHIASVVIDADTGVVNARNVMDLHEGSAQEAFDAIVDMVSTAPFPTNAVTIACTDPAMIESLSALFAHHPEPAEWFTRVTLIDCPSAFAHVASARSMARGQVAVVDIAADGAPHTGFSVAMVDTESATVLGAADPTVEGRDPVAVAEGAQALNTAVAAIAVPHDLTRGFLLIGSGAEAPGVAIAVEYQYQCPVEVAPEPVYSSAEGAALAAMSTGKSKRGAMLAGALTGPNRWVAFMAATVAAILLAGGVIAGIVVSGNDSRNLGTVGNESTPGTTSSWPETLPSSSSTSGRSVAPQPEEQTQAPQQPRPTAAPPPPPPPPRPTAPPSRPKPPSPPKPTTTPPTTKTSTSKVPSDPSEPPEDSGGENPGDAAGAQPNGAAG